MTFNKMCYDLDPSCNESAPNKTSYHNLAYDVHVFIYILVQFFFQKIGHYLVKKYFKCFRFKYEYFCRSKNSIN